MDFHSLTRKALQALCKQNGIPANITNVAMADSLSALPHVEGLEELLNQSPEKIMIGSASVSRTAARTTTRRAATKKTVGEEVEQVKAEVPPKTPAAPSTRRRAPAASARQKTETLTETTSVQRAYSTRRSVRLLGKTMSKMSLDQENTMASSIDELSADTMDCSEQSESSVVKGSDMQTVSEGTSNGIEVSEVLSELKSNGQVMDECLGKDSEMEVQKDPKLESGMKSEVSTLKAASDVIMISEVMDESSEESSADKESHCQAQNLVIVKDADDVIAAQSALPQEVDEPPSAVETVELNSSTLSSSPTKSPTSKIYDVNVAATIIEPKEAPKTEALGDYSGKFDFESGSSMEGDSEDEGTEDESVDEASSELQVNDARKASEEENSDDESTDEGESSDEDEFDDDITEDESSEDEAIADKSDKQTAQKSLIGESADAKAEVTQASSPLLVNDARKASEEENSDDEITDEGESSDEDESADDITEDESSEDEAIADKSDKQTAQKSLIGESADAKAEVTQASSPLLVNDARKASEEENSDDEITDEGESSDEDESADDITEDESSEDEAIADKSDKQVAQKSLIGESADAKAEVTQASSPLLVNLATQFPRPTSAKSSGKKRPEITMYLSDDNEESLDTSNEMDKDNDIEEVEMKKKDDLAKVESAKEFEAKSLRQLKKLLKSQLNIGDSKSTKVGERGRVALSEVSENQMVVKEN